jgi:membrane protease YdiL (CAAX protease family)
MKKIFRDPQGHVRNGWKVLAFVLVTALVMTPVVLGLHLLPASLRPLVPKPIVLAAGVLLATWICVRAERESLASIGWNPGWRAGGQALAGLGAGIALLLLCALMVWLGDAVHLVRAPGDTVWNVVRGAAVMLGVGVMEELAYRGYPMQRAIRGLGLRWGMALFALLFCASHPMDAAMSAGTMVVAMLNLLLFALLMGVLWWRTGSLAASIGLHMGWNWTQQTLGFGVSGIDSHGWWTPVFHGSPDWLTGGAFGLEASATCTIVMGAALFCAAQWRGLAGAPARLPAGAPAR